MKRSNIVRGAERSFHNLMRYSGKSTGSAMLNANGAGAVSPMAGTAKLNTNNRTLTFVVKNSDTDSAQTATLFGANIDLIDSLQPAGITVTVRESSHQQVKLDSIANPFRIIGLKYKVSSSADQYDNPIVVAEKDSTGKTVSYNVQPSNWSSAGNFKDKQIDALDFEVIISGNAYLQTSINAGETATFIFTIMEKVETKNELTGKGRVSVASTYAPTGKPEIDLLRQ